MTPHVADAVARRLGAAVVGARPVGGGDINDAYAVDLADGRRVFVKVNARAPDDLFAAEAHGLAWLAEAAALRVPKVLAIGPAFLVLEYLAPGRRARDYDEQFGRGLAALHRFGAPQFGLDRDNYIGRLPQANAPCADWAEFYRSRRLVPQVRRAADAGWIGGSLRASLDRLCDRIDVAVGPAEPPARLHGDLWSGNAHVGPAGEPCLIDPAAYGGHREVDLAMMQLFGGFGARVFDAYAEAYPLAPDWRDRMPLYQLYFLLVHVNLFGAGYVPQVEAALRRCP
ncbi:MAG: fructosamine kinase [Deltaproteobacteria bacterium]|nr:MAG: fructosamine kinase [Deltaproteobacteria bacterium]